MNGLARRPKSGAFRSWSDGRRVHLVVQFSGTSLGRAPVTMHGSSVSCIAASTSLFLIACQYWFSRSSNSFRLVLVPGFALVFVAM